MLQEVRLMKTLVWIMKRICREIVCFLKQLSQELLQMTSFINLFPKNKPKKYKMITKKKF